MLCSEENGFVHMIFFSQLRRTVGGGSGRYMSEGERLSERHQQLIGHLTLFLPARSMSSNIISTRKSESQDDDVSSNYITKIEHCYDSVLRYMN